MNKEIVMEEEVTAASSPWHDIDPPDTGFMIMVGSGIGVAVIFALGLLVIATRHYIKHSSRKKKHHFGIKRGYFKDKFTSKFKNPPPVSNPDRGSHYLKKSPSPTSSTNTLPGSVGGSRNEDYTQRKIQLASSDQNGSSITISTSATTMYTELNETSPSESLVPLRRMSSKEDVISDSIDSLGTLHFTMKYSLDRNALIITVNKCTNLPPKDVAAKTSDPYVKLQLLPEKQHKVKTRVLRRTLNPIYDEDFTFYGVNFNQLSALTLHFVILSFDRYSRDDVIGEVLVELGDHDLSDEKVISREITPRSLKLKCQGRGELLVSLCYQPASNRVTVVVLKARNLPKMDITGLSDPYVKIYLHYNGQRIAKKKTMLPNFDDGETAGIKKVCLEFLLLDWDRVTKNEIIGRLELGGPNCKGSALRHWNDVISSPRRQIAEWHKLNE